MEPPRYIKALNISLLIIIIMLTLVKVFLNFTETSLNVSIYIDLFFNFILLVSAMAAIIFYKTDTRIISSLVFLLSCICVFLTSIISGYTSLIEPELKIIFVIVTLSRPILGFFTYCLVIDDPYD